MLSREIIRTRKQAQLRGVKSQGEDGNKQPATTAKKEPRVHGTTSWKPLFYSVCAASSFLYYPISVLKVLLYLS